MKSGQIKTVIGDRGYGIHDVELIKKRPKMEKDEKAKTGIPEEIWEAKKKNGDIVFITRTNPSDMFQIDPFITQNRKFKKATEFKIEDDEINANRFKIVDPDGYTICYFKITDEGPEVTEIVGFLNLDEIEAIYKAFRKIVNQS